MLMVRVLPGASNKFRTGNKLIPARDRARVRACACDRAHTQMASYEQHYNYKTTIIRFRDGDTLECFLECRHCKSCHKEVIRLLGIESWEPSGRTKSQASHVATLLTEQYRAEVGMLTTNHIRRDRYGRILSDIVLHDTTLTELLVKAGHSWYGVGKPQPIIQTEA